MKTVLRTVVIAGASAVLVACGGGEDRDLNQAIQEIITKPRGSIEPPPEFKSIATYKYDAHHLRAPFSVPVDERAKQALDTKSVTPDFDRAKEYLEGFSLSNLRMKGTINSPDEQLEALVQDSDGELSRVRIGSYIGRNFGLIVSIDETRVEIIEIVPDGQDNWVERPTSLLLSE